MIRRLAVGVGILAVAGLTSVVSAVVKVADDGQKAKVAAARSEFLNAKNLLTMFKSDCGRYPTTAEGLAALTTKPKTIAKGWTGPYSSRPVKTDPWANKYRYVAKGKGFEVLCLGSDGKVGGTGYAADLLAKD